MRKFIKLDRMECDGNRITYEFSSDLKVFRKNRFFVEYRKPLEHTKESILALPFAALMAPVSWAEGATLVMPSIDDDYARGLEQAQKYFRRWFEGRWSFESELLAARVKNKTAPAGWGMLFSGGLDSLTTYVRHRDRSPELFMIFGADIPLKSTQFIEQCRERFDRFSREEGVPVSYIYTDIREVVDQEQMKRFSKNWYGEVAHGLMLTSLTAPASYERVANLVIAGCSHGSGMKFPCGSDTELMDRVGWGASRITNDNNTMSRPQKINRYLKPNPSLGKYIRVCWMQFEAYNCGKCEKCLRTICELLVNNMDPAECNFPVTDQTLAVLREKMTRHYYSFFRSESVREFWRAIRDSIDLAALEDRHGARNFFQWFLGFEALHRKQNKLMHSTASLLIDLRCALGRTKNYLIEKGIAVSLF